MKVIVERAAGLDIQKSITACVRTPAPGGGRAEAVRTFPAFLDGFLALRGWLESEGVEAVAMEATGSYWLAPWRVLEAGEAEGGRPFALLLCNARHIKHVPGRKTDVKDAQWICQLLECGLLTASLVPSPEIRHLREMTRYRKKLTANRTAEIQRTEKTLEDAVIKLGAVASSTMTVSGRKMIEALIAGERDPEVLAELALGRMRGKLPELVRALDGRFGQEHAARLRPKLDHIDWLTDTLSDLDDQIQTLTEDWAEVIKRLQTIPGVGLRTAQMIVAETGGDMTPFPTSGHLASWVGLCPGHHESGGKQRSGRTRAGNPWLRAALIEAAWAAARSQGTYLAAKFRRVAGPRPDAKRKARGAVAVAHKIIIAAYHIMSTPGQTYEELGPEWLARSDQPERRKQRLVRRLKQLGYDVNLTPAT
ncbi:MAG: IS110 family transposase [Acidimicrobiia bacterium]